MPHNFASAKAGGQSGESAAPLRRAGKTKINGVAGPRQAVGIGKFTKVKGSGKWNGTGPSGVWTADRA